ncbi:MAG TPA: helix-turn-helix transcriptional regulator [Nocardioides sp.]|nr:helix-turn-helix transcriptional regulator [Nocardioides sp.]
MSAVGVLDRVERLCREPLSPKALREHALEVVRRAVPFDAHVWLLTDPVTCVGTSPLADVPMLDWTRLPELSRQRYLTTVNRWPELRRFGTPAAALAADGDPARSALWREVLDGMGVTDVVSTVYADRFGCWAWLDLWRCGDTFSGDEVALLAALSGPLTDGIRAAQSRTFVAEAEPLELAGPAVVLLDDGLRVVGQTATAGAALMELNPPGEEPIGSPIPAAALNVSAALVADEAGVPVGPAWSRVHLGAGRWVTLRAERMTGAAPIAVTIEVSTFAERREVFALAHGLSPREREVLGHLTSGADSRTMARSLVLSEYTVNDHVRAVLAKCDAPTRGVLMSRIAGD